MRWSFIRWVVRAVSPQKRPPSGKSCSRRCCAVLSSSVSSSDLGQSDSEVPGGRVKLWRVLVIMARQDLTYRAFGPGYSKDKDGGREMEGREGHFLNSRREGRAGKRTSPSWLSPQRALREAKRRSDRPDPRHPEISGGLWRLHRRVHRHLGAFLAIFGLFFRSHRHRAADEIGRKQNDGKKCGPRKSIY